MHATTPHQGELIEAPTEAFSSVQAAKLAKITFRQLNLWVGDNLVTPSIVDAKGRGTERRWSFRDICIMKAIARLRSIGVTPKAVKRIAQRLREEQAEFTDLYLVYDNSDVCLKRGEELVSMWKSPDNLVMVLVVSLQQCEEEVRQAMAA
jgi:DNA-binding transcriptional MerR regulator